MCTRLFHWIVLLAVLFAGAGPLPARAQDEIPPETAPEAAQGAAPEIGAEALAAAPVMNAITPLAGQRLEDVIQVAAGGNFTCALTKSGAVFCWGANTAGQLGNGTNTSSSIPAPVSGLGKGVTFIAAGTLHACAVLNTGEVKCWGYNNYGQLGDDTKINKNTPVMVEKLADLASAVSAGEFHTCAVLASGAVQCWGLNSSGQLGNGTTTNSSIPVFVSKLIDSAKSVAAGFNHTCAVLASGDLQCWGYNIYGQLGDGTKINRAAPVLVKLAGDAAFVDAGQYHTCAALTARTVQCWGLNSDGQLGDGTTVEKSLPVSIPRFGGVVRLDLGMTHSCAVLETGSVQCWGLNSSYQLGDGTNTNRQGPVAVINLGGPVGMVGAGASHTCAVISGLGMVQCWGTNAALQLGNGYQQKYSQPIQVPGLKSEFVAAGNGAACAVDTAGAAYCWGSNLNGKLGDGTTIDHNTPEPVSAITDGVLDIQYGLQHACALTKNTQSPVVCWGDNAFGQLGDGSNNDRSIPVSVVELPGGVTAISAGDYHTCALTGSSVWCWGRNTEGQLGDGRKSGTSSNFPVPVDPLGGTPLLITGGGNHTCAATNNVNLPIQCWGQNDKGQLGNGSTGNSYSPVDVDKVAGAIFDLSAGSTHTCAVLGKGEVVCWGSGAYGELGNGANVPQYSPVYAGISGTAVKIAGGQYHTCALMSDQSLQCWGYNFYGQLGDGTITNRNVPSPVTRLFGGVTQVSAGINSTCAAQAGGLIYCWGNNTQGQMGLGSGASSQFPDWVLAPLKLYSISPTSGMNNQPVRVTLKGSGFQHSSIVQLVSGDNVVELEEVYLIDGNTLTASIPGSIPPVVSAGKYDVKILAPSGNTAVLAQSYEVLDYTTYNDLYAYTIDFVVGTASKLSKSVYAGQPAQLSLVVRRLGTNPVTTPGFRVTFYASDPIYKGAPVIGFVDMPGLGPNKMARSPSVNWTPSRAGVTYLYAKIDSLGQVQEIPATNENNNVISRMVWVLPGYDTQPPVVNSVAINGPEKWIFTASQKVNITTSASDNIGVAYLLFTEYVFVQARENWEPVQKTGWLPYSTNTNLTWLLDPTPGAHYIKVWAADKAGNISLHSGMSFINYMPERDYLAAGEYRVFHQYLNAGNPVTLTLKRFYGSALLYAWPPNLTNYGLVQDPTAPITFCAPETGLYQYEVEGVGRLPFRGGTSYHFWVTMAKDCRPLSPGEPSLMVRGAPGSDSLPADDDTGVDPAPAPAAYLPVVTK